jgi:hypothetical protein
VRAAELGQAGLTGWRAAVADRLAGPIANRTPLSEEQARALIGAGFFAISVYYVASTVKRIAQQA